MTVNKWLVIVREMSQVGLMFAVVLICAKIFEWEPVAGWSWFWVLSPLLVPPAIVGVCAIVIGFIMWMWPAT